VSAALLRGATVAAFPRVPGWSAVDVATRAVAEHAVWLRKARSRRADVRTKWTGALLSGARAGFLLESARDGEATLPVTFAATAFALTDRLPHRRTEIEEAYAAYRDALNNGPPVTLTAARALAHAVDELGHEATARVRADVPLHLAPFVTPRGRGGGRAIGDHVAS
jgi:hypothetical protein